MNMKHFFWIVAQQKKKNHETGLDKNDGMPRKIRKQLLLLLLFFFKSSFSFDPFVIYCFSLFNY